MSWNESHSRSEELAADAEIAWRNGESQRAADLYREAAIAETAAFDDLDGNKQRTRGVTAVSAVALWYKARDYTAAEKSAYRFLAFGSIPPFAEVQLRSLLNVIWTANDAEKAGVRFVPGEVLVSVIGGEVIHGGAPLDLVLQKVESVQSALFRTVEMLLKRPFRKRGGAPSDIQSMFRPWLLQAQAGSYQFGVRVQEPPQRELWEEARPTIEHVTSTFLRVLRASASDPTVDLRDLVPSDEYRGAFLNLSRNLAPTGKSFDRLEIRDASAPHEVPAVLVPENRQALNALIRAMRPPKPPDSGNPETMRGVLRAVHLDKDWLEISIPEFPERHTRIDDAGEALDDIVGPMVNRRVVLTVVRRGNRYLFRDIEIEE